MRADLWRMQGREARQRVGARAAGVGLWRARGGRGCAGGVCMLRAGGVRTLWARTAQVHDGGDPLAF